MGWDFAIYKGTGYCFRLQEFKKVFSEKEIDEICEIEVYDMRVICQGCYEDTNETSILIGYFDKLSDLGGKDHFYLRGNLTDFVACVNCIDDENFEQELAKNKKNILAELKCSLKLDIYTKLKKYLKNQPKCLDRWIVGTSS